MSKLSSWGQAIAQNLAAALLYALGALVVGGVTVWLASLTPIIEMFAPLSYLLATLVAVLMALAAANLSVSLWRKFFPLAASAPPPVSNERSEAVALISAREMGKIGDLRRRVAKLEDAIKAPEVQPDESQPGWLPPTMPPAQMDRLTSALAEIEDFLRDRFPAFLNAPNLGKFHRIMARSGVAPLQRAIADFGASTIEFSREFDALISRHDTELKIVDVDLVPLKNQMSLLRPLALSVAETLGTVPLDWRGSSIIAPHIAALGNEMKEVKELALACLATIKDRRISVVKGAK